MVWSDYKINVWRIHENGETNLVINTLTTEFIQITPEYRKVLKLLEQCLAKRR